MFKRLFFALIGLGAGVTLGVWAVRKFEEAQRKLTPEELARSATTRMGAVSGRLADVLAQARAAASAREAELRAARRSELPPDPSGL